MVTATSLAGDGCDIVDDVTLSSRSALMLLLLLLVSLARAAKQRQLI